MCPSQTHRHTPHRQTSRQTDTDADADTDKETQTQTHAETHTHKENNNKLFTLGDGPGPASIVVEAPIPHVRSRLAAGRGWWHPDIDSLSSASSPFVSLFLFLFALFSFDLLTSHGSGSAQNLSVIASEINSLNPGICICDRKLIRQIIFVYNDFREHGTRSGGCNPKTSCLPRNRRAAPQPCLLPRRGACYLGLVVVFPSCAVVSCRGLLSCHPRPSSVEAPVYRGCPCRHPRGCAHITSRVM